MKKLASILLSIAMLLTMTAGMTFTASADDYNFNNKPKYDGYSYSILNDGTVQIIWSDNKENYVIPSYIDGRMVTSIKSVGASSAPYGGYKPASITIPETVTTIENGAFWNLKALGNIYVSENNPYYTSVDGVLFNKDKTELICYPGSREQINYTVPDGVKRISDFAFHGCAFLRTLTISDSVEYISENVFGSITYNTQGNSMDEKFLSNRITDINVTENNKSFSSLDGVLFNKDKTVLIAFPQKKLERNYEVPNTVTTIGKYAFIWNTNLDYVVLPDSVKSVEDYAFLYCYGLERMTVSKNINNIGLNAFGTLDVCYSEYMEHRDRYDLFYGGSALQWAKLVKGKNDALRGFYTLHCSKASKLDNFRLSVSDNKTITIYDYYGDASDIVIPSKVEDYKITWVYGLGSAAKTAKKITIGSNVERLGSNVKRFDSIFILFTKLESINVSKSNKYLSSSKGVLFNKKKTKLITFPNAKKCSNYKIPASVKEIAENAFYNCRGLKAITVDKKNKYFSASKGVLFNKKKTVLKIYPAGNKNKSYTVPKTVKTIDNYAFSNCKYLQTIKFSKKVTSIEPFSFNNCKKIKHVYYSGSKSDWKKIYFHYDVGDGIIRKLKYDSLASYINGAKIHYKAKV